MFMHSVMYLHMYIHTAPTQLTHSRDDRTDAACHQCRLVSATTVNAASTHTTYSHRTCLALALALALAQTQDMRWPAVDGLMRPGTPHARYLLPAIGRIPRCVSPYYYLAGLK